MLGRSRTLFLALLVASGCGRFGYQPLALELLDPSVDGGTAPIDASPIETDPLDAGEPASPEDASERVDADPSSPAIDASVPDAGPIACASDFGPAERISTLGVTGELF